MSIFRFQDYKEFLRQRIESMHPTRVSQIINGEMHFTIEQASRSGSAS